MAGVGRQGRAAVYAVAAAAIFSPMILALAGVTDDLLGWLCVLGFLVAGVGVALDRGRAGL